jgi:hypothetical protein
VRKNRHIERSETSQPIAPNRRHYEANRVSRRNLNLIKLSFQLKEIRNFQFSTFSFQLKEIRNFQFSTFSFQLIKSLSALP